MTIHFCLKTFVTVDFFLEIDTVAHFHLLKIYILVSLIGSHIYLQ